MLLGLLSMYCVGCIGESRYDEPVLTPGRVTLGESCVMGLLRTCDRISSRCAAHGPVTPLQVHAGDTENRSNPGMDDRASPSVISGIIESSPSAIPGLFSSSVSKVTFMACDDDEEEEDEDRTCCGVFPLLILLLLLLSDLDGCEADVLCDSRPSSIFSAAVRSLSLRRWFRCAILFCSLLLSIARGLWDLPPFLRVGGRVVELSAALGDGSRPAAVGLPTRETCCPELSVTIGYLLPLSDSH